MKEDHIFYQVSLKLLLHHKGKVLILRTKNGDVDLPGGRIKKREEKTSFKKILSREIKEELGVEVRYRIGEPLFWYRGRSKHGFWVFVAVRAAEYLEGKIKLSNEHKNYEWINPKKAFLKRKDFAVWDQEKYLAFKECFAQK